MFFVVLFIYIHAFKHWNWISQTVLLLTIGVICAGALERQEPNNLVLSYLKVPQQQYIFANNAVLVVSWFPCILFSNPTDEILCFIVTGMTPVENRKTWDKLALLAYCGNVAIFISPERTAKLHQSLSTLF